MMRAQALSATGDGGAHWLRAFATSDVVGCAIGLFGAGWTLATSGATPAALRVAGLYLAAVAGFFVARTIARRISPWLPAFAVVAFAAVVAISDGRTYTAGPSDRSRT